MDTRRRFGLNDFARFYKQKCEKKTHFAWFGKANFGVRRIFVANDFISSQTQSIFVIKVDLTLRLCWVFNNHTSGSASYATRPSQRSGWWSNKTLHRHRKFHGTTSASSYKLRMNHFPTWIFSLSTPTSKRQRLQFDIIGKAKFIMNVV